MGLNRAGQGREEFLGHAVTLVGAFADMVIHLDDVEDFMVAFIAEVGLSCQTFKVHMNEPLSLYPSSSMAA